jgi:hypothetical protein
VSGANYRHFATTGDFSVFLSFDERHELNIPHSMAEIWEVIPPLTEQDGKHPLLAGNIPLLTWESTELVCVRRIAVFSLTNEDLGVLKRNCQDNFLANYVHLCF